SLVGVFITLSRGALVGIAAGVSVASLLLTPWALLAATGAAGLAMGMSSIVRERVLSIANLVDYTSNIARLHIWEAALKIVHDHLWFGVGPGNFYFAYPSYATPGYENFLTPHSVYLNFITGWGLVGGALFFGWIAWVIVRTWQRGLSPLQK